MHRLICHRCHRHRRLISSRISFAYTDWATWKYINLTLSQRGKHSLLNWVNGKSYQCVHLIQHYLSLDAVKREIISILTQPRYNLFSRWVSETRSFKTGAIQAVQSVKDFSWCKVVLTCNFYLILGLPIFVGEVFSRLSRVVNGSSRNCLMEPNKDLVLRRKKIKQLFTQDGICLTF